MYTGIGSFIAFTLLAAAAGAAHAATEDRLLVTGVLRAERLDLRLTNRLTDHLDHQGLSVVKDSSLSPQERLCADQECLQSLAVREGATLVLTVQVKPGANKTPYLSLALLDVATQRLHTQDGICEACTSDSLPLSIDGLTDRAVASLRKERAKALPPAALSPTAPEATTLSVPLVPMESPIESSPAVELPTLTKSAVVVPPRRWWELSKLPRSRKVAAGVLGGLGIAALGTSIALITTHGQQTGQDCNEHPCAYNNITPYSTSIGITVALGALTGAALFWPTTQQDTKETN